MSGASYLALSAVLVVPAAPADTFAWPKALSTPVGRYAADPAISRMAQRMLSNRRRR